jgi:hypothetical protein
MSATKKQRAGLSLGTFLLTQVGLAAYHEGAIGFIVGCGITYAAWKFADEVFENDGGDDSPQPLAVTGGGKRHGLAARLLKSQEQRRAEAATDERSLDEIRADIARMPDVHSDEYDDFDFDDDDETQFTRRSLFRFSELLASGFVPSVNKIFVGRTMNGQDIFVPATKLCHVAISGKTGGGKGSLMRMIMTQLCFIGVKVLLLNPHYMRMVRAEEGVEFDEDWSPFEGTNPRTGRPYLEASPIKCAEFSKIEERLQWAVEGLLQQRMKASREEGVRFAPYFIVIDEWPSIAKKIKAAPDYLAELLREGRKFGIFVIVASQDFQVKTIGMEGGSVRKCLLTCFYTGGDPTTAKELLYPEPSKVTIPESDLGKGTIMMRCTGTENKAVLALVPFVDNKAVYRLLGPSTFVTQRDGHEADELEEVTDENEKRTEALSAEATVIPNVPETGPRAADIDIDLLVLCWNGGANSVEKLMKAFKMTHHQATLARKRIMDCANKHIEEATE